jgi:hypothetical protein
MVMQRRKVGQFDTSKDQQQSPEHRRRQLKELLLGKEHLPSLPSSPGFEKATSELSEQKHCLCDKDPCPSDKKDQLLDDRAPPELTAEGRRRRPHKVSGLEVI